MESYDLEPDKIINWAVEYASYDELESTAKAIYSLYITRRKTEKPDEQKKAKKAYHQQKTRVKKDRPHFLR